MGRARVKLPVRRCCAAARRFAFLPLGCCGPRAAAPPGATGRRPPRCCRAGSVAGGRPTDAVARAGIAAPRRTVRDEGLEGRQASLGRAGRRKLRSGAAQSRGARAGTCLLSFEAGLARRRLGKRSQRATSAARGACRRTQAPPVGEVSVKCIKRHSPAPALCTGPPKSGFAPSLRQSRQPSRQSSRRRPQKKLPVPEAKGSDGAAAPPPPPPPPPCGCV